jgi:single-stranded DNA-binding protein
VSIVHLNQVNLIGRISKTGPQLRYAENGVPVCSLVVEVDEFGPGEKIYTSYIPVDVSGKHAEQTSVELEAGDLVQISGKLRYKSTVDAKTSQKVSKMIVSTWGIQQRERAHGDAGTVTTSASGEQILCPRGRTFNQSQPRPQNGGPGIHAGSLNRVNRTERTEH